MAQAGRSKPQGDGRGAYDALREDDPDDAETARTPGGYSDEERRCCGIYYCDSPCFPSEKHRHRRDPAEVLEDVPRWLKPDEVMDLVEASKMHLNEEEQRVPMWKSAGAAMPRLFLATVVLWSSQTILFLLSANMSECRDDFWAVCPLWILFAMVPPLLLFVNEEVEALRFTIVPKYQVLQRRRIYGVRVDFYLWLVYNSAVSAISFINQCLTCVFFGTVWMTADCPVGMQVRELWEKIPILRFASPRAVFLVAFVFNWVRLIYALCNILPTLSEMGSVRYAVASSTVGKENAEGSVGKENLQYHALFDRDHIQNHGGALATLSEANAMVLLNSDNTEYVNARASALWTSSSCTSCTIDSGVAKAMLYHANSEARRCIIACLTGILGGGLQLILKVMFFGIMQSLNNHTDWPVMQSMSLAMGFFSLFVKAQSAFCSLRCAVFWYEVVLSMSKLSRCTSAKGSLRSDPSPTDQSLCRDSQPSQTPSLTLSQFRSRRHDDSAPHLPSELSSVLRDNHINVMVAVIMFLCFVIVLAFSCLHAPLVIWHCKGIWTFDGCV